MSVFFKNEEYEKHLRTAGFVLLNSVLNEAVISQLDKAANSLHSNLPDRMGKGFFVGLEDGDKSQVRNNFDWIQKLVTPVIAPFINNYSAFAGSYIYKRSEPDSFVFPHQDWTFVENENIAPAITCWIPLCDVNEKNGCLGVLKGSQRFFNNIRFSPNTAAVPSPFAPFVNDMLPYFTWIPMEKGDVLFFDYRIIHASLPNRSNHTRTAIGLWYAPSESRFCHYYLNPDNKGRTLLKYEVPPDFYLEHDNFMLGEKYSRSEKLERYSLIGEMPIPEYPISKRKFLTMIKEAGNVISTKLPESLVLPRLSWIERLKKYL